MGQVQKRYWAKGREGGRKGKVDEVERVRCYRTGIGKKQRKKKTAGREKGAHWKWGGRMHRFTGCRI